ncbi:MAG: 4Fe-4S dicluster domain-containing protein [Planctomycetota bacterium]|nr:4Fe-4S dicluster domain-containing protein [Planctomycetota bacterium]
MDDQELRIDRPKRWDQPFGEDLLSDDFVDRALTETVLSLACNDFQPGGASISEILRNDARKVDYQPGEILIRRGDYGGSVFFGLSGSTHVLTDPAGEELLQTRKMPGKRTWWQALSQLWQNSQFTESRHLAGTDIHSYDTEEVLKRSRTIPCDLDQFIKDFNSVEIPNGRSIGEIAALRRSPRSATVFSASESVLLELRWQAIRDICRKSRMFREYLEEEIRTRSPGNLFANLPLFDAIPEEDRAKLLHVIQFERQGNENWNQGLRITLENREEILSQETLVVKAGWRLDGIFVMLNGFARISTNSHGVTDTVDYLRPGDVFGLEELLEAIESGGTPYASRSMHCIGTTDLLLISTPAIQNYILPHVKKEDLLRNFSWRGGKMEVSKGLLDFLVNHRTINGNQTMIIDLDRCTDCDDCVKACAITHDGNPRFIREGHRYAQLMVASACMHCCDPVCLIGCPTGSIHREPASGNVIIHDESCIGCATCVEACPYDNIRTVEIKDSSGRPLIDSNSGKPILRATKCDLCIDQPSGPACVNSCPHDALHRVDFGEHDLSAPLWKRS